MIRAEGLRGFAGVPLLVGDRLLGGLAIATDHERAFGRDDVDLLLSLANQAAVALDNARLLTEEQTRRQQLGALLEINTKIGALVSTETLLTSIAGEAARLLGLDNAGFRVVDGDDLVQAGLAGTAGQTMLRRRLKIGESLSGKVVAAGRTLVVSISEAADLIPEHAAADAALGYTTYLGVPLCIGARTIGVLTFRARRPFTARDQELAEAFAGQAAVAIEHARLYGRHAAGRAHGRPAEVSRLLREPRSRAARRANRSERGAPLRARAATLFRLDDISGDSSRSRAPASTEPSADRLSGRAGAAGRAVQTPAVTSADVLGSAIILPPPCASGSSGQGAGRPRVPLVVNDRCGRAQHRRCGRRGSMTRRCRSRRRSPTRPAWRSTTPAYQEARTYAERVRARRAGQPSRLVVLTWTTCSPSHAGDRGAVSTRRK